jgi:hypothetical protein
MRHSEHERRHGMALVRYTGEQEVLVQDLFRTVEKGDEFPLPDDAVEVERYTRRSDFEPADAATAALLKTLEPVPEAEPAPSEANASASPAEDATPAATVAAE